MPCRIEPTPSPPRDASAPLPEALGWIDADLADLAAGDGPAAGDADAVPVSADTFENFCVFLSAGCLLDEEFTRMLGMGFRIGAPPASVTTSVMV
jgi:hypothetical protein